MISRKYCYDIYNGTSRIIKIRLDAFAGIHTYIHIVLYVQQESSYSTYEIYVEHFAFDAAQDEHESDHVLSDGLSASMASSMAPAVRCVVSISIIFA